MNKRVCACGCGTELPQDGKFEYVRGHKTKGDKPKRVCACGCGRPLVNRHPYIKGHNPDAKKTSARPRSPRNGKDYKASPPRNSVSRSAPKPNGIATLCVTEQHLDSFWMKLTLEEKANLFQRQLEGA
jgi:hypothetical protein